MYMNNQRKIMILTCITFFSLGISTAVIGPILAELANNTQSTLSAIGAVISAMFLGALISQIISGPIIDRFGQKLVLSISLLLIGVGMLTFTFSHSIELMLLLVFLGGLGHGAVDLSASVLVARTFSQRSVSAVNLLNFFFGLGAFIGPVFVSRAYASTGSGLMVVVINAIIFLLVFPFILRLNIPSQSANVEPFQLKIPLVYRTFPIWIFGLVILIYVGSENGLGGWISSYMTQTVSFTQDNAALVSAGFWLALTIGRLVSAWIGMSWSPEKILLSSMGCALAGSLLFASSTGNPVTTILAVILTGFGFGAIYPTTIAIINNTYQSNAGKATSLVAALGSLGGVLMPWIQGIILERFGPSASAWFVMVLVLLMGSCFSVYRFGLLNNKAFQGELN